VFVYQLTTLIVFVVILATRWISTPACVLSCTFAAMVPLLSKYAYLLRIPWADERRDAWMK
jgi:hypothetical protein